MGKWFATGYDDGDREREAIARSYQPNRFWMKEGTSREIVFVDDEPFAIHEHNWKANGHWRNYLTCLAGTSDVTPCCEKLGSKSRSYVGYYTVIDTTEHKDKKGNIHQYEMKFFPAKLGTLPVLKRKKESKGSLVGWLVKVTRDKNDDPNVGNDFEPQREVDLERLFKVANYRGKKMPDLFKEALEKADAMQRLKSTFQLGFDGDNPLPKICPFNYESILEPRSVKEVRSLLGSAAMQDPDGNSEAPAGTGGGADDDQIPF